MSARWADYDDDDPYTYELRPNATCSDCGTDFSRADHDRGMLCDLCSDRHDAHTAALELRLALQRIA